MQHIEISEAAAHLPEIIQHVLAGDEIILTQDDKPVAVLSPVPSAIPSAEIAPGSAKGLIWMADDFDAPLEEFEEYM
jgi:antitoxin (DNA-binding transcriptional repressor) of toxin-antitoxin stability system